jgi:hypothetical protein
MGGGKKKFSQVVRRALWEGHGKTCFYCREPLAYKALQIDHLIPEKFCHTPTDFEDLKNLLDLDPNFNLHGFENLIPACWICNNRKSDTILISGLVLLLGVVAQKKAGVEKLVKRYGQEDHLAKLQFYLTSGIETGKVKAEEIEKILKELKTSKVELNFQERITFEKFKTFLVSMFKKSCALLSYFFAAISFGILLLIVFVSPNIAACFVFVLFTFTSYGLIILEQDISWEN